LVSPAVIRHPDRDKEKLPIDLSVDKIRESPAIEEDRSIARSVENDLNAYYGWRTQNQPEMDDEFEDFEGDLRSTYEITGFYVEADDGEFGHVEDFIIDDEDWTVKYLVIDTKNWWPAKKVLLYVEWVDSLGWDEEKVFIALSREEIRNSPEFDYSLLENGELEAQMFRPLNAQGDWKEYRPEL